MGPGAPVLRLRHPDAFHFSGRDPRRSGELDGNLVVAGAEGVTLYDKQGQVSALVAASFTSPVVQTGGGCVLAYDAGGTTLLLLDRKGQMRLEADLTGTVYDADLTEDGYLSYVTQADTVKSELQVLDREQRAIFTVHAATRFFTRCAAAPGGETVCAVALGSKTGPLPPRPWCTGRTGRSRWPRWIWAIR